MRKLVLNQVVIVFITMLLCGYASVSQATSENETLASQGRDFFQKPLAHALSLGLGIASAEKADARAFSSLIRYDAYNKGENYAFQYTAFNDRSANGLSDFFECLFSFFDECEESNFTRYEEYGCYMGSDTVFMARKILT